MAPKIASYLQQSLQSHPGRTRWAEAVWVSLTCWAAAVFWWRHDCVLEHLLTEIFSFTCSYFWNVSWSKGHPSEQIQMIQSGGLSQQASWNNTQKHTGPSWENKSTGCHCTALKNPPPLPFPTVRWHHAQGGSKTHSNVYKNTQQPCQFTISLKKALTGNCLYCSFRKWIVLMNASDETDITFISNRKWKKPFKSMNLLCCFFVACDYWIGISKISFLATKYFRAENNWNNSYIYIYIYIYKL